MIVTIHQPNFFPWLGFFDKMELSDLFVLLDTVPFTKGGFQNRVQVKGPNGTQWLTLPVVTKGRMGQATLEVEFSSGTGNWKKDHEATFASLYRRCAGFETLAPALAGVYAEDYDRMVEFTIPGIQLIRDSLGIKTPMIRASALGVSGSGSKLLLEIVKTVGGTRYLSGPSGREYLDNSLFESHGVAICFHRYRQFEYPQRFGQFVGGLSALDYLFNQPDISLWRQRNAYMDC